MGPEGGEPAWNVCQSERCVRALDDQCGDDAGVPEQDATAIHPVTVHSTVSWTARAFEDVSDPFLPTECLANRDRVYSVDLAGTGRRQPVDRVDRREVGHA